MAILLIGVNNSRDRRAPIQNGFWGPKIVIWLGLIVATFLIPNSFFEVWGNYVAFVGAILFLLLGLVLLVDLAHTFAEYCIEKIEDTESGMWRGILIGATLGMYVGSIAMTIVMYIFFANSGCSMNQAAITVGHVRLEIVRWANEETGQSLALDGYQRHVYPSDHPGFQPSSRPRPGSHCLHLLHLSDHVCSRHGAG